MENICEEQKKKKSRRARHSRNIASIYDELSGFAAFRCLFLILNLLFELFKRMNNNSFVIIKRIECEPWSGAATNAV